MLRFAEEHDISAILGISNWAALNTPANFAIEPEPLQDWVDSWRDTHQRYPWLVAEDNGQLIGFAKASPHRGRCAYAYTAEVTVYVHPQHHARGIGKSLYQQLFPILKVQGYCTLLAGITQPNPASERLHASFGFRRIGVFERVGWKFGKWHDVGYWELIVHDGAPQPNILNVKDALKRLPIHAPSRTS
jgi:phosphinothricin acetyltransferase